MEDETDKFTSGKIDKKNCTKDIQRVPKNVTHQFPISILTRNRNQTFFFMRLYGFTEV
jgi:hypothetical protein